ncbi:MAG TPA: NADH-quinone oxidoreductase subunit C [bacterium]|nr:NADH-quinone oxidoreductase subunit C [bacterium]
MANEEAIKKEISQRFGMAEESIRVARERRVFCEVGYDAFRGFLEHVCKKMGFAILCTITGQDEGETLSFMYHTARSDGTMLNIKTSVLKSDPRIKTVTDLYPVAISYERELVDLLGAAVEGLPPGKRYPLPDGWPEGQYPLRKDWKPDQLGDMAFPIKGA